jgi:uncharacterized protein
MLALATVLFAPMLASGEAFGRPVAGAVAPASLSVLVGAGQARSTTWAWGAAGSF